MAAIEIKIEQLAYGGEGIGRNAGKVCFVENALPGEIVRAEIVEDKKKFSRAKVLEILKPSPLRIQPICQYYDTCGGCQYQHVSYQEELRAKEQQVRDYLSRQLAVPEKIISRIVASKEEYHYRQSATLHRAAKGTVGFFAKDNQTVISIEGCPLLHEKLSIIFQAKPSVPGNFRLDAIEKVHSNQEKECFTIKVGSHSILTHPKGFFQNNLEITEAIGKQLKIWIEQQNPQTFIDLYAGCGTFTLLAAENVAQWILAEENPFSLLALEKNFENAEQSIEVLEGKVEKIFPKYLKEKKIEKAFLFLDPPRQGMEPKLADTIVNQKGIESIAYLSCHLGTLTRDLGSFLKKGEFAIQQVMPFDMFPRTKHMEILVLMQRRNQ